MATDELILARRGGYWRALAATQPTKEITVDAPEDKAGAISRYREGPSLLEAAVVGLNDEVLDFVPAGGGWTVRQIVHHVVDGDDIWKLGIKIAMRADQAEFALGWYWEVSQQTWGERWAYGSRSLDASLALLKAIRVHILQLLENAPDTWNRAVLVRNRDGQIERIPVGFVIQMQADHLFHHVQRIRDILKERGGALEVLQPTPAGAIMSRGG